MYEYSVKINEVECPISFNMTSVIEFKKMTGKNLFEINGEDFDELMKFMYCVTKAGSKKYGVEYQYDSYDAFYDYFDSLELDGFVKFNEVAGEVFKAFGEITQAFADKGKKKKEGKQ